MDNGVARRQNTEESIKLLAAQWAFYVRAKVVARIQFFSSVCVPVGLVLFDLYRSDVRVWISLTGLLLVLLDECVLEPWKTATREKAASIQELFDVNVLELEWSEVVGRRPSREDILIEKARTADRTQFMNWYTNLDSSIPLEQARIICQRANCVWDSSQRRLYANVMAAVTVVAFILVVALGLYRELALSEFVLAVLAPFFPFLMWAIRERRQHMEAAIRLEEVCRFADYLWSKALTREVSEEYLRIESRRLQDSIFHHRASSPLVEDWFYNMLRPAYENRLKSSTSDMVEEAKRLL